jgi:hypothetical protein
MKILTRLLWPLFLFILPILTATTIEERRLMASSDWDDERPDGWTVTGPGQPTIVLEARGRLAKVLAARGHGGKTGNWEFVAPEKFLGDKREAFGGNLEFILYHADIEGSKADHAQVWGVKIASSSTGVELGARSVVGLNRIALDPSSWKVTKGRGVIPLEPKHAKHVHNRFDYVHHVHFSIFMHTDVHATDHVWQRQPFMHV